MKRLFAAIKIHPDKAFLQSFRELRKALLLEQIKWVEEHNIHVTLKFFGETDERKIPEIARVIQNRANLVRPFQITLAGLGIFGSTYAPRVVWTGIEPYDMLVALMNNLHSDLASVGFEPDRQNQVPHLTLGRIKSLRDRISFQRTVDRFRTIRSETETIDTIKLYESILRREGPEYREVETFGLA